MSSKKMIMVVDDNPVNLRLVNELLALAGFDTMSSADAEQALEVVRTQRPDLILMDIALPGMDGLQLTRMLKSDPKMAGIPVVAVTAFAMKSDLERAAAAGCDGVITKPINTRTFVEQIMMYL